MIAKDNGGSDFIWERDQESRTKLWKARHDWWYAGLGLRPGSKVLVSIGMSLYII